MRLDPATRVPLYQQIVVILRNKIQNGDLLPGQRMMGEAELCELFGVSRITARRALNDLADGGFVVRRQGSGTHVSDRLPPSPLRASIDGLLENVSHIGRTTSVKVLEFGYVPASPDVAEALSVTPGHRLLRAVRVRNLGDAPMSHLVTWVPEDIGAMIEGQDMSRTPLLILLERAGVPVTSAHQTISATLADAEVANALSIPAGAPLIDVRRIVYDDRDRPVEFIKILYRPELYRFQMSMRRVPGDSGMTWQSEEQAAQSALEPTRT